MTRLRADLLLLLAALIWGTAFIAQKTAAASIGPLQFVAGRFLLSAIVLAPFALRESRRRAVHLGRRDWALALTIGLCLFAGTTIQQFGMRTTSVTDAGFITALYIAFVPFVARMLAGTKLRPSVLAACAISLLGAWLLAAHGQAGGLAPGDLLVLGAAILYAFHIALIALFQTKAHRPFFLSFVQFGIGATLALALAALFEPVRWGGVTSALPAIAYAGLLSGGVGFTLQVVAQRYTPAAEAALIMSLESVFAAAAAAILLGDRLTIPALIGCGLILSGVIMVEIGPALPWRRRPATNY
jgi:drug/metabolite transporter (DMT)-like permease